MVLNGFTEKNKLSGITAGATKVEDSSTNGNIKINGTETNVYTLPTNVVKDSSYVHTDNNYTTTEKNKLSGIASGAEVNVQADWNVTDTSSDAYIQNKPVANTTLDTAGAFADAKAVGDAFDSLEATLKAGTEETADYHLGFYLDENGDLCQVDE